MEIRITEAPPEETQAPALRPSEQPDLACAHKYAALLELRSNGHTLENIASRRGTQFHEFMLAQYIPHLVDDNPEGLDHDEEWWRNALDAANITTDTRELLDGYLPSFRINPESVLHVEKRLYLDANLEPTDDPAKAIIGGQPDLVLLETEIRVRIPDFKTQFQITNAEESFQAKAYSLLVLQHMPFVEEVEFELAFVRYGNSKRSVTFNRSHVPHLKNAVLKTWQRKQELHRQALSGSLEAPVSGAHCLGCPLRLKGCKIAEINDYANQSPEDLTRFILWAGGAINHAREILKDMAEADPSITVTDGTGRTYSPKFVLKSKRFFGKGKFTEALEIVRQWVANDNEKRTDLLGKLYLGGIGTYLKARFRKPLLQSLEEGGHVTVEEHTEFRIVASGMEEEEQSDE